MEKLKIAAIEDGTVETRIYKKQLTEGFQHELEAFESGEEFLAHIENIVCDFDVILLDYELGRDNLNGIQVHKKLLKRGVKVPVILVTAYNSTKKVGVFMKQGGAAYYDKPIDDWGLFDCLIRKAVRERKKELEIEELRRKAYMLEAESVFKTAFSSIMAHEIRNPLQAILGNLDLIRGSNLQDLIESDGYLLECFRAMEDGVLKINLTIDSLLTIVRLDSEREKVTLKSADLGDTVEGMVAEMVSAHFMESDAVILTETRTSCDIDIDKIMLFRVLFNLLQNAVRYANNKPIRVITQCRKEDPDFAEVLVIDEGRGIDTLEVDSLFERFFSKVETEEKCMGCGLGLYISKKFVEAMNGEIWVKSEIDKGSIFGVKLRKAKPESKHVQIELTSDEYA